LQSHCRADRGEGISAGSRAGIDSAGFPIEDIFLTLLEKCTRCPQIKHKTGSRLIDVTLTGAEPPAGTSRLSQLT
jgi:hypothetical protein